MYLLYIYIRRRFKIGQMLINRENT